MGIRVVVVGAGQFAQDFIPLFKAHPLVEEVGLADLNAEKLRAASQKFDVRRTYPSLDAACASDATAIVLITQHWLHAPQAVQALRAGKDVWSAVPAGATLAQLAELAQAVEATRRVYMMAETSHYYPAAVYCRQRLAKGDFGALVYAETEYYHDWDHGLYEVMEHRLGPGWHSRPEAGWPPMHYPTHSVGFLGAVTGAYPVQVSCLGIADSRVEDRDIYRPDNADRNVFSNQVALMRNSDGTVMRCNEFRRVGHPGAVALRLFGTEGSFVDGPAGPVWTTKHGVESLREQLEIRGAFAAVHPVARLPEALRRLPDAGHEGSHKFLVDDFVQACLRREHPPVNVWQAVRYTAAGLVAHASSLRNGQMMPIPAFADGSEIKPA